MLESVNFFTGLNTEQLAALEQSGDKRQYKKGSIILGKDDTTDYLFVLVRGNVNAYIEEDGKRIIVNSIGAGESFGELAMLSGEPRSANIVATENCEVLVLQKTAIDSLMQDSPQFSKNLVQMLAKKVNALTEDVSSLALLDVYRRIARVLEQHTESGKTSRLTQQDIADRVGSSREMVSRILKDLRIGGYIAIEHKQIEILKPLPKAW
jgi:CRP/FNR family cyclic AMP-dependent transcriptional regulator